jgi:hypothetical protein
VDKTNFLSVYAQAHVKALSKENIISAFRKTGVVPFNPDVITDAMLAPSIMSSSRGGVLPLPQTSPVRVMEDMIHRQLARQAVASQENMDLDESSNHEGMPTPTSPHCVGMPHISTPIRVAVGELASTSAAFLVSNTPPRSRTKPPSFTPYNISPLKPRQFQYIDLGNTPLTPREALLYSALHDAEERDVARKKAMIEMQATTILQGMYVTRVQGHLQEHEERAGKKNTKNRMFGDGYAKLLDADEFYNKTLEIHEQAEKKAVEKEERARKREEHAVVIAEWKKNELARKSRNEEVRRVHQDAIKSWEVERDLAKGEKRKPRWVRPKQGLLEKPVPRPKKPEGDDSDADDEDGDEEDGDGAD